MKSLKKKSRWTWLYLLIISLCVGCAPELRKGGFLDDYSNMQFVSGMSGGSFQWVDPAKDLRNAKSIAVPDFQLINPVGDTPEDAELRKAEMAAAKKVVEGLVERLKAKGTFARVERSGGAPVDLILRGAVTEITPPYGLLGYFRLQVEAYLVEVRTGQVVGRVQATGQPGAPPGLFALLERKPEDEVINQLAHFFRTKVKKLE